MIWGENPYFRKHPISDWCKIGELPSQTLRCCFFFSYQLLQLLPGALEEFDSGVDKDEKETWLVVSTHLKNISQIGSFPQVEVKIQKYLKPPSRNTCADVPQGRVLAVTPIWSYL